MDRLLKHTFPPDLANIYDEKLANQLANTQGSISSLNQMALLLPNPLLLMRPILAKEAESSSQLEGTQASVEDAYSIDLEEQSPEERNEALEIRNYERAMLAGLELIDKRRLNNHAIRAVHKELMQGVRGKEKTPGTYRDKDVHVGAQGTGLGEARYIPPSPAYVSSLMEGLEKYYKECEGVNPLISCGVVHYRFEAIHPFEDGNGRVGRLLISLHLIDRKLLTIPILYPSGYFEKNRKEYTDSLSAVDKKEDWYTWLIVFLKGMERQAKVSLSLGLQIDQLLRHSKELIEKENAYLMLNKVLEYTFTQPIVTVPLLVRDLKIPKTTCQRYLEILNNHEILSKRSRNRKTTVYANTKLLSILMNV
jgi:Fic family protein